MEYKAMFVFFIVLAVCVIQIKSLTGGGNNMLGDYRSKKTDQEVRSFYVIIGALYREIV